MNSGMWRLFRAACPSNVSAKSSSPRDHDDVEKRKLAVRPNLPYHRWKRSNVGQEDRTSSGSHSLPQGQAARSRVNSQCLEDTIVPGSLASLIRGENSVK
ncbi:hypothetical protein FRB95_002479 [Tulasnella sp. JGI-2019a]|nr:hypothetical protein FRB95_002479 [Tulasnella sp. JGI-2019a]